MSGSGIRCLSCDDLLPPEGGLESAYSGEDGHYCYDCVATPRIALVGCGESKVDVEDGETVPARDLYDSNYFQLKREYAETCCDEWRILSAKHRLLSPDEEIESYDASLSPRSDSYIGDYEAGKWAVRTGLEFQTLASFKAIYAEFVILAGEDYVGHIEEYLEANTRRVTYPFRADDLEGIGDQQSWLRSEIDSWHPPGQADISHWEGSA